MSPKRVRRFIFNFLGFVFVSTRVLRVRNECWFLRIMWFLKKRSDGRCEFYLGLTGGPCDPTRVVVWVPLYSGRSWRAASVGTRGLVVYAHTLRSVSNRKCDTFVLDKIYIFVLHDIYVAG